MSKQKQTKKMALLKKRKKEKGKTMPNFYMSI